jgi:8-oxo-dGTP pyrophosphatase MutT (NUDIX family)
MTRNNLLELLYSHIPFNDAESCSVSRFISFVKSTHSCFERTNIDGHVTVSIWLLNSSLDKTLLTHHKKFNVWLQLGGHADGDFDVFRVGLKEAQEESGLKDIFFLLNGSIFDVDVHEIPAHKDVPFHYHYDVRFLASTSQHESEIKISEESNDLQWFAYDDPCFPVSSHSLVRMHQKWRIFLKNNQ